MLFAMCWLASPAQAAYRYWGYWLGAQQWTFASVGPAFRIPADGTVEGWRFAVSSLQSSTPPAISPDFDAICGPTPAREGHKRVAVIVDPGSASDAPPDQQPPGAWAMCVSAEPDANGMDILRSAADVRLDRGFVCAVAGYPARECAPSALEPTPSPSATQSKQAPRPPSASATPTPERSTRPGHQGARPHTPAATPLPTSAPVAGGPASAAGGALAPSASPRAAMPSASVPSSSGSSGDQRSPEPTTARGTTTLAPAASASPSPSYSLLATPLTTPGDGDGGSTAALITVLAVAAIGALGFAALVRGRRQP